MLRLTQRVIEYQLAKIRKTSDFADWYFVYLSSKYADYM
jgi:hypothetical protein